MITKNQQNTKSDFLPETNTEVPAINPNERSPSIMQPTLYDYLTILPVIITAATPLILGLRRKQASDLLKSSHPTKKQDEQTTKDNNDVTEN
ncbi:hypothetical protein [Nostoc sp.]|uniref:hypothetical protein n=1 Tax=Nostoc sp. TaxID=1180 RepID=UPI00359378AC